jgi:hypothetical protein
MRAMLKRIWTALVGLLRKPDPTLEELPGVLEVDAEKQATKEQWAADEGRQTRRLIG